MIFYRIIITANLIFFTSLLGQDQFVMAESNLLKTESIRKKLYDRMDERKKSKTFSKVSEKQRRKSGVGQLAQNVLGGLL